MRSRLNFLTTRFGQRLFLLFALCALVPITALALVSYGSVYRELREQAERRLADSGKSVAMGLWERLSILDSELQILIMELDSASARSHRPSRSLLGETTASRFLGLVAELEDGTRTSISGSAFTPPILTPEDRVHLSSGQPLLEIVDIGRAEPRYLMGRSVTPRAGEPVTLWGEINPGFLWWGNNYETTLPAGIELTVLDRSRKLPILDTLEPVRPGAMDLPPSIGQQAQASFEWQREDESLLAHYRVVNLRPAFRYPDLTLVVSKPEALVSKPLTTFKRSFLAISLGTLLVVMLASIRQIRSALTPLDQLQAGTRRLASGDLGASVDIQSDDEFAELARSFNYMAWNLDRQFATLSSLSQLQQAVLSSLDAGRIASTVLDNFGKIFPSEHVAVVLLRPGDHGEGWLFTLGDSPNARQQVDAVELTPRELSALSTIREHVEWHLSSEEDCSFITRAETGLETLVAFPIFLEDELVAVIATGLTQQATNIDPRDYARARQLCDQVAVALSKIRLLQELDDLNWGILSALGRAIDVRSPWTMGHTDRVTALAQQLGRNMGLSKARLVTLQRGSLLHDIGKIGVPSEVLDKPGALTEEEMGLVRQHVQFGVRIVEPIPALVESIPVILQHHEWFDGRGYPAGLAGSEISLEARILAVADCYDALRSDRPYRPALPHAEVVEFIRQGSGGQFDPRVVEAFLQLNADDFGSPDLPRQDAESDSLSVAL